MLSAEACLGKHLKWSSMFLFKSKSSYLGFLITFSEACVQDSLVPFTKLIVCYLFLVEVNILIVKYSVFSPLQT